MSTFFSYLPQVLGALVVLVIGYLIARLLRALITRLLKRVRLDDRLTHGTGGEYVARFSPGGSPAQLVGIVVQYVLLVFVIVSAVSVLNIPAVTGFMNLVLSYLPNVLAALLIFLIAAALAAAVGGIVHKTMGDTPTGRVVRSGAPALVMAIAVFMILNQLGIAPAIVTATYIAIIGSAALAAALAFGLGGRDAAAELINSGYRKAQEQSSQVQADLAVGRERGGQYADQARNAHETTTELPRSDRPTAPDTANTGAPDTGAPNIGGHNGRSGNGRSTDGRRGGTVAAGTGAEAGTGAVPAPAAPDRPSSHPFRTRDHTSRERDRGSP